MRKLLAGLAVLAIVGIPLPGVVRAQEASPTAVVVASPSAEGCDDIGEYLGALKEVGESAETVWTGFFPDQPYVSDMSNDDGEAKEFHQTRIDGTRLVANMLRDAAGLGLFVAFIAYEDLIEANDALEEAQGQAALTVCPAFQQVLDYYADEDEGTPEAG